MVAIKVVNVMISKKQYQFLTKINCTKECTLGLCIMEVNGIWVNFGDIKTDIYLEDI